MASTTKTTKLNLSQFAGTDIPDWITDYSGDMKKIDDQFVEEEGNALASMEAVMAVTEPTMKVGAGALQEMYNSFNKQKNIDNQISFTQPTSGNVTVGGIRAWTKGNVCGVSVSLKNIGDWASAGSVIIPISGFPPSLYNEWSIGLVVGANPIGVYKNTANTQILLRNLGNSAIAPFENYAIVFTYAI